MHHNVVKFFLSCRKVPFLSHLWKFLDYLSGEHAGGEGNDHAGLDDTSLHTAHGNSSNASNFVHILQ